MAHLRRGELGLGSQYLVRSEPVFLPRRAKGATGCWASPQRGMRLGSPLQQAFNGCLGSEFALPPGG